MVDFTKDVMGGQGPVALGESLLSQARERTEENRRRRDKNAEKMLLATLGGKLVGSFLNKKFDNDLQTHLNSKDALAERALVRSAVDSANRITEQERAANAFTGGRRAYYMNALTEQNKAYMLSHYAKTGVKPNESDIAVLAKQEAANQLETYLTAIDKQVAAAQNVVSVTGGDRLAYGKAIREAAGEGDNILGRMGRRVATLFSKNNPGNSKDAIYRSTTTSQIYKASEQFKNTFDSTFNITGDSAIATRAANAVSEGKIREAAGETKLQNVKINGQDVTMLIKNDVDGNFAEAVPLDGSDGFYSDKSFSTTLAANRNQMASSKADPFVASVTQQIDDEKLAKAITGRTIGDTDRQTTTRTRTVATALDTAQKYLKNSFGDAMTDNTIVNISARMHELDYEITGSQKEIYNGNILLAVAAIDQEYDGLDNAPISVQRTLESNLKDFFNAETGGIRTMSSARIQEIATMFDNLDYSFTSQLSFGDYRAADILALAYEEASILEGFKTRPKFEELMPKYSRKQDVSKIFSDSFSSVL